MFTTLSHDYYIEPVPEYLHNVRTVGHHDKPHIVLRRSVDGREGVNSPLEQFWKVWEKAPRSKRSCATKRKFLK